MKFMTSARRFGTKVVAASLVLGSAVAVHAADAGIAAAATSELSSAKSDANTVGVVIIGIVAAVAVIGIIIGLVRRGGK